MNHLDHALILTLGSVALKYNKPYCYPSQKHICRLLFQHHGLQISLRTLNRHLQTLELDKIFARIRRHRRSNSGKIIFNTTLYKLKKRFFKFMGYLKRQADRFSAVFRMPFSAQYQGTTPQVSTETSFADPPKMGDSAQEGGRKAPPSSNLVQANLQRLRQLLKTVGKRS